MPLPWTPTPPFTTADFGCLTFHRDDPGARTAVEVVNRIIDGSLSPADAGRALAAIPIGPGRGDRDPDPGSYYSDPTSRRYAAFHPLDVATEAFFNHHLTVEQNTELKYAYVAAQGRTMPDPAS